MDLSINESDIAKKIYDIRGQKVMLSGDLADLYQVKVKVLNQQIKRNTGRFPERYVFKISIDEYRTALRSQNVTLKRGEHAKYPPYAFTEHGVLMLSSVLRSKTAEKVNMLIIDTFVKLRVVDNSHKDLMRKLDQIELSIRNHDKDISVLFEHLRKLLVEKKTKKDHKDRKRIGFQRPNEHDGKS